MTGKTRTTLRRIGAAGAWAFLLLGSGGSVCGGESPPPGQPRAVLDISGAPDIVFTDLVLQMHIRAFLDREAPRRPPKEKADLLPATLQPSFLREGFFERPVALPPVEIALPPYSAEACDIRFPLAPAYLSARHRLRLELRAFGSMTEAFLSIRPAGEPGKDLEARGLHLYTRQGERVMLGTVRWGESAYRRWAVPRAAARWASSRPDMPVVALSCDAAGGDGLAEMKELFLKRDRDLRIIRPSGQSGRCAPILGLLAAAGRLEWKGDAEVLLSPGTADIAFGTPPALYGMALHALVSRMETVLPSARGRMFLALPALPPGLSSRGEFYRLAAARVAKERHMRTIDLEAAVDPLVAWGAQGAELLMVPAAREALARRLAAALNPGPRDRFASALLALAGLGFFLLIFRMRRARRRFRALVAHTCGEGETPPAPSSAGTSDPKP
ncbi:MAG: SGNH/GDSL hydrolase family protein [Planctomycetota bacterium]